MAVQSRLIIENGVIIPLAGGRAVLPGGHVVIEGSRIAAVGAGPAPDVPGAERIDAEGGMVLPGLIDTHAHAGHALTKGLGGSAGEWMRNAGHIYARATDAEFWRAEAALSALERLRCGTTTAALLLGGGPDVMRTENVEAAEAHIDGVASIGVAEVLAVGPNRPDGPKSYLQWSGETSRETAVTPGGQLDVTGALLRRYHGAAGGLMRLAVSLPVFTALELAEEGEGSPLALSRAAIALARDHGVLLAQDGHRDGSIAAAAARGALAGPGALFAHCIDLTEGDIAALKSYGAAVAHNPSALMSVFGRCPAPELMAMGVPVGLGSDAPAPDRAFDMFRIMFQAHRYHARHFADDSVLPPWDLLEMAAIGGARALGLHDEIGSLEVGKRADIIIVDWRKPHLWPRSEPVQRLTRFASGADADTVIIAGRVLMRGRRLLLIDENKVLDDAAKAFELMLRRAGLSAHFAVFISGHDGALC